MAVVCAGHQSFAPALVVVTKREEDWRVFNDFADKLQPRIRAAFLEAARKAQRRLRGPSFAARVRKALERQDLSSLLAVIGDLSEEFVNSLRSGEFVNALEDTYIGAARLQAARTPTPRVGSVGFRFDMTSPTARQFIGRYQGDLIRELGRSTVDGIMDVVRLGYDKQVPIFEQQKMILGVEGFGLTTRQNKAVFRYWQSLREAGMSAERAEKLRNKYQLKMLKLRAENITRTETIRAANFGRLETWTQAAEQGLFDETVARRFWVITPDDRLCEFCRGIAAMNKEGVPLRGAFRTPDGYQIICPPGHPQCRCAMRIKFT